METTREKSAVSGGEPKVADAIFSLPLEARLRAAATAAYLRGPG